MNDRTSGTIIPQMAGVGFVLTAIFFMGIMFARTQLITGTVRAAMQAAVTANVAEEKYNAFDSIREGLSGAYAFDSAGQAQSNVAEDVQQNVVKTLELQNSNGVYVRKNGVQNEYSLSGLSEQVSNPSAGASGSFTIIEQCTLSINMPMALPPVVIPLSVTAELSPKF